MYNLGKRGSPKIRTEKEFVQSIVRSIDWLIDWLTDWLIDRLFDQLIDWLIDWSIDRLIDWWIDWWYLRFAVSCRKNRVWYNHILLIRCDVIVILIYFLKIIIWRIFYLINFISLNLIECIVFFRWIIFRRLFVIIGLLYFGRSVTMLVTALPVANTDYYCSEKVRFFVEARRVCTPDALGLRSTFPFPPPPPPPPPLHNWNHLRDRERDQGWTCPHALCDYFLTGEPHLSSCDTGTNREANQRSRAFIQRNAYVLRWLYLQVRGWWSAIWKTKIITWFFNRVNQELLHHA